MIQFPVLQRLEVENYSLFPGTRGRPGVDFTVQAGMSVIAGVNGLGKTTLINMLYRLLVGPWELPKDTSSGSFGGSAPEGVVPWPLRTKFFSQRVADRARTATATLHFRIGLTRFSVTRDLATCRLVAASAGREDIPVGADETPYQDHLVRASGLGRFVDFLSLVKYLTFFNEERRDILWDNQAQRQFFRILFVPPEDGVAWSQLEAEINRADSTARNAAFAATRMSRELARLEEQYRLNSGVGDELAAAQRILDADLERQLELQREVEALEQELRETRRSLERAKLFEDEALRELESIRYTALLRIFPELNDTAAYILTHLFAEGRCLACEADAPAEQRRFEKALQTGDCPICGASPLEQRRLSGASVVPPADLERRRIGKAKKGVENARTQREALTEQEQALATRWRASLDTLSALNLTIAERTRANEALRARLPPEPEELEQRRRAIALIRRDEETARIERRAKERLYEELLSSRRELIQDAIAKVAIHFQKLASAFLEEDCSLEFRMIRDRPSQAGEFFLYPSLKFEMTAAAFEGRQIRDTPDDVSESQREFIDLAFRMGMVLVASGGRAASLVIETPEASLDVIFMKRAAAMLRSFASNRRSVIVTSNLTNSGMIPGLLGSTKARTKSERSARWSRVLNLLQVAEPNAAVRRFKSQYKSFLSAAVEGRSRVG
jgi:hypothetical protein